MGEVDVVLEEVISVTEKVSIGSQQQLLDQGTATLNTAPQKDIVILAVGPQHVM